MLKHPQVRILHLIRDPRDVVVSAMHYHRTATEPWLHKPWRSFGGMTYQEKINSLENDQARYIFEMQNSARQVIRAMRKWNYKRKNTIECRYENLITDYEAKTFTEILRHLGFEDHELKTGRKVFLAKSLFGNSKKNGHQHIRSGEGQQWKRACWLILAMRLITHGLVNYGPARKRTDSRFRRNWAGEDLNWQGSIRNDGPQDWPPGGDGNSHATQTDEAWSLPVFGFILRMGRVSAL
jgi:hypothetical protein